MSEYIARGEPFFFVGNGTGCLLIHGFGGTPYEMRELGTVLHDRYHYSVLAPALAGHATRVQDLARTDWRDWYSSVEDAYRELKSRCSRIFAVGLSAGGALALHLAAHRPLGAVVAVSAPAYITHRLEPFFRRLPILFTLVPIVSGRTVEDDTLDPHVRELHPGYDNISTLAAKSLILEMLPHVRQHLPSIRTPALLLQGRQDRTIPYDSMSLLHAELGSREKRSVWLEPSGHLALEDYAREQAFEQISEFIAAHADQR